MELIHEENLGNMVICDYCNEDYTYSDEEGGILFGSKAVCPRCAPNTLRNAEKFGELDLVKARCPKGMSFKNFVIKILRNNQPGMIKEYTFDNFDELEKLW